LHIKQYILALAHGFKREYHYFCSVHLIHGESVTSPGREVLGDNRNYNPTHITRDNMTHTQTAQLIVLATVQDEMKETRLIAISRLMLTGAVNALPL
jgi:hypothetical protein